MKEDILRLVCDYSINGKLADERFVEKAIELTVEDRNLQNYVNKLRFVKLRDEKLKTVLAAYNFRTHNIMVDLETLPRIRNSYSSYDRLFSGLEKIFYRNLVIMRIVQHELWHANQVKQIDSNQNDLETELLRVCFRDVVSLHNAKELETLERKEDNFPFGQCDYYRKRVKQKEFYWEDPSERLARIHSLGIVVGCLRQIKGCCPNVLKVGKKSLLLEMVDGYRYTKKGQLIAPTQVFLEGIDENGFWQNLDFYDDNSRRLQRNVEKEYCLQKRLQLGLPIRSKEYRKIHNLVKQGDMK